MTEIIEALQEEIAAAEKKRLRLATRIISASSYADCSELTGYIQGLQTAVDLLEKEQARELPY